MPFPELRPQSDHKIDHPARPHGFGLTLIEVGLFLAMIAGLSYLGS